MAKKMIIENGIWYLVETPDEIVMPDGNRVAMWNSGQAYPFGFANGYCYVGPDAGMTHSEMGKVYRLRDDLEGWEDVAEYERQDFEYAGRLWADKKVISFWEYPPFGKLKSILKSIESEFKSSVGKSINIMQFRMEIPSDHVHGYRAEKDSYSNYKFFSKSSGNPGGDLWTGAGYLYAIKNIVTPGFELKGQGNAWKKVGGDINTQDVDHVKSPMQKKGAMQKLLKTKQGRQQMWQYFQDKGKLDPEEERMWKRVQRQMGIKEGMIIESIDKIPPELQKLVKKHDPKELAMGIEAEKEHDDGGPLDVVKNQVDLLKIALAHLEEDPHYYTHLKAMEDEFVGETIFLSTQQKRELWEYFKRTQSISKQEKMVWKTIQENMKEDDSLFVDKAMGCCFMTEQRRTNKRFNLQEGVGKIKEAPHISVGDEAIDLEFEGGKIAGLKRVLNILLGNQVVDKYGNKFQLKSSSDTIDFIKKLSKNHQVRSELR